MSLLNELRGLQDRGVDTAKLLISADAHLLMPYHITLINKVTRRYMGGEDHRPWYRNRATRTDRPYWDPGRHNGPGTN